MQIKLKERDEEVRFIQMAKAELQREVALEQKLVPQKKQLQRKLVDSQVELVQVQHQVKCLEYEAETPERSDRWRVLESKQLSRAELVDKLAALSEQLDIQQTKAVQKATILQQKSDLVTKLELQTSSGKEDALTLAKAVNDYQYRIKDLSRKLMAAVAELSIYQVGWGRGKLMTF